ncbi:MAG TPA: sigma-54 dependent transcriptional regulator [Spirochaetia bacterium]|nr:sigma-54 dependent transcriptional regulator [Spirochaetia bacterium]
MTAATLAEPRLPILMVDDEPGVLESQESVLRAEGYTSVLACRDAAEALRVISGTEVALVLLDLALPGLRGEDFLAQLRLRMPDVPVIVVTSAADIETAVRCMKAGAFDYMLKPVERSRFSSGVRRALELRSLKREFERLRDRFLCGELLHPAAFAGILTRDPRMLSLFHFIEAVAPSSEPVLVLGETGVGKELIARAVHEASGRPGELVTVNAAGLDDTMFADTLFGHRRGAYTGAAESRRGLLAAAGGGSVFLDEIGDVSGPSQVKLLRLLDSGEYFPLGSDVLQRSDARFILATNRDLPSLMSQGRFRADLYYRLSTHQFRVPPLRERRVDIPVLLEHFLKEASAELRREPAAVTERLVSLLQDYPFPGNVRELRSLVFDAVGRQTGSALPLEPFLRVAAGDGGTAPLPAAAPPADGDGSGPDRDESSSGGLLPLRTMVDRYILQALSRADGNLSQAARALGITPQALSKRLQRRRKAGRLPETAGRPAGRRPVRADAEGDSARLRG